MIFEVDKDAMQRSITIADSIVSSKNVNTILSNCLFKIMKDEIEIISTDSEIGIRTRLEAVSDGESSFTLNGKRFAGILKELPKGSVTIKVNDSFMIDIQSKAKEIKAHMTLIGTSGDEYPDVQFSFDENMFEINQGLLKDMFKKVIHAAAIDTIKPVFNGVYLISDTPGKITAVATDSRRLSIISRSLDNSLDLPDGVIIPLKTVNEILRLLTLGENSVCRFSLFENQSYFEIGDTEIVSRVVDGQFPNYKQVIPKEQSISAIVETKRLLDSLKRALVFTREPANKIIMHFKKHSLKIEVSTPDLGESEEEIPIESNSGESISIGINAHFLLDSLRDIESHSIVIGLTGQMSPVTISPENDPDFQSVIMPIQIKSA